MTETMDAAAVLKPVTTAPSMIDSGIPVSSSNNVTTPGMVGRPRSLLAGITLTILMATPEPLTYPGMKPHQFPDMVMTVLCGISASPLEYFLKHASITSTNSGISTMLFRVSPSKTRISGMATT